MTRILLQGRPTSWQPPKAPLAPTQFHESWDGYAPSPLVSLPAAADELNAGRVEVKMEVERFGLPSFKIMGASWATIEALRPMLPTSWRPADGLPALAGSLAPVVLCAATDGNHGHALARIARMLGLACRIFVPDCLPPQLIRRIASEGAQVVQVPGTYDDAVARSAQEGQRDDVVVVSDTSWEGYEQTPAAVIDGYATILHELELQWPGRGGDGPDLVLVQLGVGSLAAAVIRHFRGRADGSPAIVGIEPTKAACVMASLAAGKPVKVAGPHSSVMSGLNCGTPSLVAWPLLRDGLDGVIAVDDALATTGVQSFRDYGLDVGECAGVALSAARELLTPDGGYRRQLGLPAQPSVLLFATEGPVVSDSPPDGQSHANIMTSRS